MDPSRLSETTGASEKEAAERNSKGKRSYDSETAQIADKERCVRSAEETVQALLSLSTFRDEAGEGGSQRDIGPPNLAQSGLTIVQSTSKVGGVPNKMMIVSSPLHTRKIKVERHDVSVGQRIRVTEVKGYFQLGHLKCQKTFSRGILMGDIGTVTGINYAAGTATSFYVDFDNEQIKTDLKILYETGNTLHHEITKEMLCEGEITNIQHAKMFRRDFEIIH